MGLIAKNKLKDVEIKSFGYNDCFVEHGRVDELENKYGINIHNMLKCLNFD